MTALGPGVAVGKFELVRPLGRGGFGEVWEALDGGMERRVALKFLTRTPDAEELARFRREAKSVAGLEHPNIARVFETGEWQGVPYIALEYVDGEPLSKTALTLRAAAAAIRDAAVGLAFAHAHGILHRDVKPANLMIDKGGRMRVMDFGLARVTKAGSTITTSGLMVGTPSYMSPEQARGEVHALDGRADVWGLGATLYELVEGRPPFDGKDAIEIAMKILTEEPPLPLKAPVELGAVIMKCLEK